ncbi:MAG TPA: hypothetical protein DCX53_14200 [Anaerolineae bacterium]|nr:hypothetical protein [Anaerolineae bacterium]
MPFPAFLPVQLLVRYCRKVYFGGKDWTGDGTPEGLPLNCRFSFMMVEYEGIKTIMKLAPPRGGEPLSSSPRVLRGHALSFP